MVCSRDSIVFHYFNRINSIVVTTSSKPERMKEYMQVESVAEMLSNDDIESICKAGEGLSLRKFWIKDF